MALGFGSVAYTGCFFFRFLLAALALVLEALLPQTVWARRWSSVAFASESSAK